MKKRIIIILTACLLIFALKAYAQDHSSNTVITKIGNPPVSSSDESIDATSCPIPSGVITCGSENAVVSGCGHCTADYIGGDSGLRSMCSDPNYPGIHYAMDVGAKPLDPIFMPLVNGKKIRWTFSHQAVDGDGITAIQYYGGIDDDTQEQYWIQFHHTKPGSGGGTIYSGDRGANVCQSGCKTGTGPHVHIEFAKIDNSGNKTWVDAPNYFCR